MGVTVGIQNIRLTKHQINSIYLLKNRTDIPYVFLIGGFGCGKSFTDVVVLLWLLNEYRYSPEPINIGLFGVTIKLLRQTVIADFERFMDLAGIPYKDNTQQGTITVGSITFIYLAMQDPDRIYAFNFNCALCDEIDEIPPERVKKIVTAIQERCRKVMPAGNTIKERDPFIFFSTTAQGLGGTYQLTKDFDKNHIPYAVVRGRTQDNPHLAKTQIELLRKLYTEDEARAYLDGEFMNLSVGRVWHSFDISKHVYMRFNIEPMEHIYVGQDFNGGFNASCEIIVRNETLFIINSHHWKDMAEGAERLRQLYPTNPITMIPDSSGKEIMRGFAEEYNRANIEIYWNNKNPSITERIMAGNILFRTGRCYIMSAPQGERDSLADNAILCLQTHDFDENTGKPRKGAGQTAPDHFSDSFSYGLWRIIHGIKGFDDILSALKGVNYKDYTEEEAA